MAVAEAQERIDSREFSSWMAYDRVEPFGEDRADLRSAMVAAVVANANRGKSGKPFTPADFMPQFDAPKPQSPDELQDRLFAFADSHNQAEKRKGR